MGALERSPACLAESRVGETYALVITFTVLSTIAVALRFLSRRLGRASLWWDDWTILMALIIECESPKSASNNFKPSSEYLMDALYR